jgi:hypothetical protein
MEYCFVNLISPDDKVIQPDRGAADGNKALSG